MDIVTESKQLQFRGVFLTSFVTAVTLVIALYWQNFLQNTLQEYIPPTTKIFWNFVITILITILGALIIYASYKWL